MISSGDIRPRFSLTKDLVSDQTFPGLNRKIDVTNITFDATEGLGRASSTTGGVLVNAGCFEDQKITAVMKYVSPTAVAASSLGVIARCNTLDSYASQGTYYWAVVENDVAKLRKVNSGSFTTMTSTAWPLAQNVLFTVSLSCIGSAIVATFESSANPGVVTTLSVTDSSISGGGLMGWRTNSSSHYVRSFTAEEL